MRTKDIAKYHLEPRRLAELRNFSYQYSDWLAEAAEVTEISSPQIDGLPHGSGRTGDPVARVASAREAALRKIKIVDRCLEACSDDPNMRAAVRKAVTTPRMTYEYLHRHGLYWGRTAYYQAYHRYYWLLDKARD